MKGKKLELTDKQIKWLCTHYKNTKNKDIADKMGMSESSVNRYARLYGLKKTPQFCKKMAHEALELAMKSHKENGTFPPKGYKIPNREKNLFKKGENGAMRWGKKKERKRVENSVTTRRETIKKERARLTFGLPQKTKLRLHRQSDPHIKDRWYLTSRGYIIDEDKRIAYWNDQTKRCKIKERKPKQVYTYQEAEKVKQNKTAESDGIYFSKNR